ncbi:hypothetical protein [Flavobacterium sp.]|uniref:hypothetical protein n=1 Tax=Flavobacterium sp. TaxID=239 RepID=UPI003F6A1B9D
MNNIEIKFQEHFKLNILFKDKILFQHLLIENNISYYNNDLTNEFLYFLLDKDRAKINELLIKNEIIASTETIPSYDYKENKKVQKLYFTILLIVMVLTTVAIILMDFFKN